MYCASEMNGTRLRAARVKSRSRSLSACESPVRKHNRKVSAVFIQQGLSKESHFQSNDRYAASPFAISIVTDLSFLGPLGDPHAFSYASNTRTFSTSPWAAFELLFGQGAIDQHMSTHSGRDDN